ncbi:bifunctional lysylphosphatidylglycerol flippase/synthetase MprF [Staphylococcus edaphicus]|uniref:Phosphatidylglycerol lysyltransferase n=1 Tax=Staphylococcus edaphicus TaxID=1955013 RepID=A0A2C6VFP5_9STAP|nr:bifunctional lysylphosphatidylglycerol flippase/synthetase MprF [Staphylococcus edaphicus]PHK49131.1 phosphatidylglycerol lysyltransferase [Staphylococcus edaphicus]UQW80506.1 bifunctional lysylphosphatidylglycerol flippase/synthetase MprF [Staphylococcus edaphicus]
MSKKMRSRLLSILKIVFAVALFIIVVFTLYKELSHINIKETIHAFGKINRVWLVLLFISGGASIIVLSMYDVILAKTLNLKISLVKTIRVGYIVNALNAVVGFGGFIGASVRFLFYKHATDDKKALLHTISIVLISMLTGLSLLSILVVLHVFNISHLFSPYPWIKWLMYIVALFLPIFVIFTVIKPVQKTQKFLGVYCTLVSSVEWIVAALVLYMALSMVGIHIPFSTFMGIFIIAALSGLISFIPGGFGTFDLVIILGLKSLNIAEESIVLALLLYRFAYYLFPVLIALILSTFEFRGTAKRYWEDSRILVPVKDMSSLLASYQKDIIARAPSFSIAILLMFTSLLFFLNNLTIIYDGLYDPNHYIYYIIVSVHTCACLLLFLNVVGVYRLSKRAILFSIISIVLIFIATAYTYASFILLSWLIVMLILLLIFYRRARVIKRPFRYSKLCLSFIMGAIVLYINHIVIASAFYTLDIYHIELDTSILRYYFWFTILLVAVIVGTIVWWFEHRHRISNARENSELCEAIIQQYGGNYLSHLMYSGDKQFFVDEQEDAFLMYRYQRSAYIVLGDPIGNPHSFHNLLESFYQEAEYLGYDIIFYQVTDKNMSLYHSFGNQFFKLGEEAVIDLTSFTTSGKKKRGLRATLNKFDDLNYKFEVKEPPFSQQLIFDLKKISDEWLADKNEMHFSVGSFNEAYLSKAPIAIIKDSNEAIIAFCTLMPTYYKGTISVDLIRWRTDVALPLMDGLYLNMLLWSQKQNYQRFNMGMATLSNVGQIPYSFYGERIAGRIFEHFNGLYRFQGLRKYKEKFNPQWEPRFLVYRKRHSLWVSMIKVMRVIRKHK